MIGNILRFGKTRSDGINAIVIATSATLEEIEALKDKRLEITQHKGHRSLDANGYYWVLCTKIAAAERVSKTEMHNRLLSEYGTEQVTDGAFEWAVKSPKFDWTKSTTTHYRPAGRTVRTAAGEELPLYWVIRGSHTYDTAEMSRLIDGAVYEAKEHGIETMTPDEIERLKAAWHSSNT